jgi:DNA-directed RNA polymerase I and III subunit RPAC1
MVDMHCFARKGTGADHSKWSPVGELALPSQRKQADRVATASYRLLPHITIRSPIPREHQEKFRDCFPPGVISIENDNNGEPQCIVKKPRKDTVSREVLRHPEFQDLVQLSRIRDHFLCTSIYVWMGNGG